MACHLIDFNQSIMAVNQLKYFAKMCIPIFECFLWVGGRVGGFGCFFRLN